MENKGSSASSSGTSLRFKGRILLVDDEADVVDGLKKGLIGNGFEVEAYTDPQKALSAFRPDTFDLVILEVRMPGMTGVRLLRELKKIDGKLKAVLMSSFPIQPKEWIKVFSDIPVAQFTQKPPKISTVIDAIQGTKSHEKCREDRKQTVIRGTPTELAEQLQKGNLFEPLGHNMLVYDNLEVFRQILADYAKTFLPQNEIILYATQYDSIDDLKQYLKRNGVDVSKHLSDGTLFIIDAQHGYQGQDVLDTFKMAKTLVQRARKEERNGVSWVGDMGSFLALDRAFDLLDYELYCPATYQDTLKTVCCYHIEDFKKLSTEQRNRLIDHHYKTVFVVS
jgi:CheY-like chemotaxis protein